MFDFFISNSDLYIMVLIILTSNFRKSKEIKKSERFTFLSEGVIRKLVIKKVTTEDQTDYSCVVHSAKTSTKLVVEGMQYFQW